MATYLDEIVWWKILKRLPAAALLRFRRVCKSWDSLISAPEFIRAHHLSSSSKSKSYIVIDGLTFGIYDPDQISPSNSHHRISFQTAPEFDGDDLTVFDVIHGVVCLSEPVGAHNISISPAILWNPAIRRYAEIPPPESSWLAVYVGFGFDASKNDFKVVSADWVDEFRDDCSSMAVYSYREDCTRKLDSDHIGHPFELLTREGCFINGAIHWAIRRRNRYPEMEILVFDCESEELRTMQLPPRFNQPYLDVEVVFVHFGKLSVVWGSKRSTVWVMKEYGVTSSWKLANHNDFVMITNCGRILKFIDFSLQDGMKRSQRPWNGHVFEPSILLMDAKPTPTTCLGDQDTFDVTFRVID